MDGRQVDIFFYGLFMDRDLLVEKGVRLSHVRPASLTGYTLRIGARAALVATPGGVVHGLLMTLSEADAEKLYSDPSVRSYRPEPVVAVLGDGTSLPAVCYNLPEPPSPNERNSEYASKLRALAQRVGLPGDYVASIR
jgi:hypothetical protein